MMLYLRDALHIFFHSLPAIMTTKLLLHRPPITRHAPAQLEKQQALSFDALQI
jgi:hypothetical protein